MDSSKLLADAKSVCADLQRMAQEIAKDLPGPEGVLIVGVHGKGVRVAAHLNRLLDSVWRAKIPGGTLDVGMHRDDSAEFFSFFLKKPCAFLPLENRLLNSIQNLPKRL